MDVNASAAGLQVVPGRSGSVGQPRWCLRQGQVSTGAFVFGANRVQSPLWCFSRLMLPTFPLDDVELQEAGNCACQMAVGRRSRVQGFGGWWSSRPVLKLSLLPISLRQRGEDLRGLLSTSRSRTHASSDTHARDEGAILNAESESILAADEVTVRKNSHLYFLCTWPDRSCWSSARFRHWQQLAGRPCRNDSEGPL